MAPVGVWLAGRGVGLLVLFLIAQARDRPVGGLLSSWDGWFYLKLAAVGYPSGGVVDVGEQRAGLFAFFPGYGWLVRLVGDVGVGDQLGSWLVTWASGAVLAVGLVALAQRCGLPRRTGLVWVGLVGAYPLSVVFLMSYSEALFCAVAVWALCAVMDRRWPLAAGLAIAAGLVRPTGVAVVVVVCVAAVVSGWRAERTGRWVAWAAAAVAPVGVVGYLGWVAVRTGSVTGWFQIEQAGWQTHFDGGAATARFVLGQLRGPWSLMEMGTVVIVMAVPVLLVLLWRVRPSWPLIGYSLIVCVMALGSDGVMNSKLRLVLPAFPLLLAVAIGLSKRTRSTQVAVLTAGTLAAAWFGAYALAIYPHAI